MQQATAINTKWNAAINPANISHWSETQYPTELKVLPYLSAVSTIRFQSNGSTIVRTVKMAT